MDYALTPFLAWLLAGFLKFCVNSARAKKFAFSQIGYGGLPSNHSAIVSSTAALIAFKNGIDSPAFGVAVTLAFIVMLDAASLRRHIEKHARRLNELSSDKKLLRERLGHRPHEIFAGVLVGIFTAFLVFSTVNGKFF